MKKTFIPKNYAQILRYILNGGATTLVNYTIYIFFLYLNWNYLCANTIAWSFAVLFAYATNRTLVFHSQNQIKKELFSFVSLRFVTLLMENLLLLILIQFLGFLPLVSKLAVSIFTISANYFICKCSIFQKGVSHNG